MAYILARRWMVDPRSSDERQQIGVTGSSSAWQSTAFGTRGSQVQILSARLMSKKMTKKKAPKKATKKKKVVGILCEACGKKIPQARIKVVPTTKHCVGCVDEHGEQIAIVPIITEDNIEVAIIRDADQSLMDKLHSLNQYESQMGR